MNAHSKYGRKCNKNNDDYHNLALSFITYTIVLVLEHSFQPS